MVGNPGWVMSHTILQITGSFTASGLRIEAVKGLFLDLWGPQRLLWTPKDRFKLHLGKKHIFFSSMVSPGGCKKKNQIQDLVNWAWYTGCLDFEFCSNFPLLVHPFIWFPEILYFQLVIREAFKKKNFIFSGIVQKGGEGSKQNHYFRHFRNNDILGG